LRMTFAAWLEQTRRRVQLDWGYLVAWELLVG
jgi:hypothetical protein